jgi:hypothetical protein
MFNRVTCSESYFETFRGLSKAHVTYLNDIFIITGECEFSNLIRVWEAQYKKILIITYWVFERLQKHMDPNKEKLPSKKREHWPHLLDSTVWNDFEYRDDDIIRCAYTKSGTTRVQQIIAQLIWNGSENIILSEVSLWIDCRFPSKAERLAAFESQTHR